MPSRRTRHETKNGEDSPDLDETLDELVKNKEVVSDLPDESSKDAEIVTAGVVSVYCGCDERPEP
jgi:hypothetical protein